MKVNRGEIISRSLIGRCPNCGTFGMFKHWFRLNKHCTGCKMPFEKEEAGFYFGTTSIGYVLAIIFIIIPVCTLAVNEVLTMWTAVYAGIIGSILMTILLYPFMLSWVIMSYYTLFPNELPINNDPDNESN